MIDMAQAFGSLANQGVKVPLTAILKVTNFKGEVLEEIDIEEKETALQQMLDDPFSLRKDGLERVLDPAPAYLVSHILQDNDARTLAFGPNSELVIPDQVVSVKTGTTNDLKDNWTIGFTPEFLTIVWVGNNDNTPMSYVASGVTGAAPIWNDIMSYVLRDREATWQSKPDDVLEGTVCLSGLPAALTAEKATYENKETTEEGGLFCAESNEEFYWTEGLPSRSTRYTKEIWINPETGTPPEYGQVIEGLVLENHTIYQDPVTLQYCADCNRAVDEEGKIIYEKNYIFDESRANPVPTPTN